MSDSIEQVYESSSPASTLDLGRRFGLSAEPGLVLALHGPLGAGKTHFVRGLAHGLGVSELRKVCSPTFIIAREHAGRLRLYHVDAYRVNSAAVEAIGFEEMCTSGGVVVVEWADRIADLMPADCLSISIEPTGAETRRFRCRASGPLSQRAADAVARFVERASH